LLLNKNKQLGFFAPIGAQKLPQMAPRALEEGVSAARQ
jgi:hypothetical protein